MGGGGCRLHAPLLPPGGMMPPDAGCAVVAFANINAPVCFLRESRVAIGGDVAGGLHEPGPERHFPPISALRGQGEAADDTCFEFLAGSINPRSTIHEGRK